MTFERILTDSNRWIKHLVTGAFIRVHDQPGYPYRSKPALWSTAWPGRSRKRQRRGDRAVEAQPSTDRGCRSKYTFHLWRADVPRIQSGANHSGRRFPKFRSSVE